MFTYLTNQSPYTDESTREGSIANICDNTSLYGTLRKELVMATLRPRRGMFYARIRWYDDNKREVEKQVQLKTNSKVVARERLAIVEKVESDIKAGISFTFPWQNDEGKTRVERFTLKDAIDEWVNRRIKMGIRPKTTEVNELGLSHFTAVMGKTYPLNALTTKHMDNFVDYLRDRNLSITSINIHLRTIKAMFRYYWKRERLNKIPMIEQLKVEESLPIYITDGEFQAIMDLDSLDGFYKRVFYFYRETGCRLREPFISSLDGNWLDIPNLSKGKRPRSIELNKSLIEIYNELMAWYEDCGLTDHGEHLSKKFKKSLRSIGASEDKHFHSLRHTFAVRRIVENVPIYKIQKMMGHSSVTTTEVYAKMELKRLKRDFPTLVSKYTKLAKRDTHLRDTDERNYLVLEDRMMN